MESEERILISGATGFVGSNLIKHIDKFEWSSIGRDLLRSHYLFQELDKIHGHHYWIHLTGKAHDVSGKSDINEYMYVNFELTKKVFNAFLNDPQSRTFIFLSSVKASASSVDGILDESVRAELHDAYGLSKRAAEDFLMEEAVKTDKRIVVLRPCMIHGPGNKGNLNLLYKLVEKGIPYPLSAFDNERSFLSVENLCYSIIHILQSDSFSSGIYNISDDTTLSTNALIRMMGEVRGKRARMWRVNRPFIEFIARLGDIFHLPLNSHRLKKLTESYRVSNDKLKHELGVANLPISAEEGMRHTLKSFNQ